MVALKNGVIRWQSQQLTSDGYNKSSRSSITHNNYKGGMN